MHGDFIAWHFRHCAHDILGQTVERKPVPGLVAITACTAPRSCASRSSAQYSLKYVHNVRELRDRRRSGNWATWNDANVFEVDVSSFYE